MNQMQQFNPYQFYSQPQVSFDWIQVNNLQEVKNYDLQQNKKAWFMDNNKPVFYVKFIDPSDSLGKPTIKGYQFQEISLEEAEPHYVTAEEIEEILRKFVKENINGEPSIKHNVTEKQYDNT